MPVVDKLPALLREDLQFAFEDDMDNVFDISNLKHLLAQRKRDTEIELKRVSRLIFYYDPYYILSSFFYIYIMRFFR